MTPFNREVFAAAALLAVAAALWPGPARAETWEIVVPPNMPRSDELKAEIWDFFLRGMAPGDNLTVHDGLIARELVRIEITDDPRLNAQRVRTKALSRETALLSQRIDALSGAAVTEPRNRIAFPEFAYAYGNARTGGESHMLVITSGLHDAPLDPGFSLRRDGDALLIPNDAHIAASLSESPYGTRSSRAYARRRRRTFLPNGRRRAYDHASEGRAPAVLVALCRPSRRQARNVLREPSGVLRPVARQGPRRPAGGSSRRPDRGDRDAERFPEAVRGRETKAPAAARPVGGPERLLAVQLPAASGAGGRPGDHRSHLPGK